MTYENVLAKSFNEMNIIILVTLARQILVVTVYVPNHHENELKSYGLTLPAIYPVLPCIIGLLCIIPLDLKLYQLNLDGLAI